jgi:hypothetical protein
MHFDVRGIDHLRIGGSSVPSKLAEPIFPDAAPCPAHEAAIDRRMRAIFGRAIAPAAAALEHTHDPADNAAIIHPLDAPHVRRQVSFNPLPLFIAQPKPIPAHNPNPLPANPNRIVSAKKF